MPASQAAPGAGMLRTPGFFRSWRTRDRAMGRQVGGVCLCVCTGLGVNQHIHYSTGPKPTGLQQLKIISYLLPSARAHIHCAKPSREEAERLSLQLTQPWLEIHPPREPQVLLKAHSVPTRSSVSASFSTWSGIQLPDSWSLVKPTEQPSAGKQSGSGARAHPARHRARTQPLAHGLHLYIQAPNPRPRPRPLAHTQPSLRTPDHFYQCTFLSPLTLQQTPPLESLSTHTLERQHGFLLASTSSFA